MAEYNIKVVAVGDGGVGKTSLLMRYAQGKYPEKYVPTGTLSSWCIANRCSV